MWAPLDQIIERGRREQDMGVVAMKTLKGAKHHGLAGFREEAVRSVLAQSLLQIRAVGSPIVKGKAQGQERLCEIRQGHVKGRHELTGGPGESG